MVEITAIRNAIGLVTRLKKIGKNIRGAKFKNQQNLVYVIHRRMFQTDCSTPAFTNGGNPKRFFSRSISAL